MFTYYSGSVQDQDRDEELFKLQEDRHRDQTYKYAHLKHLKPDSGHKHKLKHNQKLVVTDYSLANWIA